VTPDDPSVTSPRARSPRLVRLLLLSAGAVGLAGLALQPGTPARPRVSVEAAASSSLVSEQFMLSGPIVVAPQIIVPTAATRVVAQRATRTRALATKPAVKPSLLGQWARPSSGAVVSPYGMRWGRMHKGIDFGAGYGDPIRAVGDGVVIGAGYLGEESGYGQITLIRHANGFVSAYAHQSRMFVQAGDRVSAGQLIGLVGSTGNSTGPHLHFEIRTGTHDGQINPVPWLRQHGVSV
jgi:murein DD-endopeptidase MepM/ murein hydrolase activator NlpD